MVEARAAALATRSIKTSAKQAGLLLAMSMLDLTTLEGKDTPEKVRALCAKAVRPFERDEDVLGFRVPSVAAVCVYPSMVPAARASLESLGPVGAGVKIAAVATAFPSGQFPLDVRLDDTRRAILAGAHEIDMVINRGALLAGRLDEVADEIRQVKRVCLSTLCPGRPDHAVGLKVILETGELETFDLVRRASDAALAALHDVERELGPTSALDFIKTSTGKVQPAATLPGTLVMLEAVRDHFLRTGHRVGVKPAGGIRTAKQSLQYLVMVNETVGDDWMNPDRFRIGASSLANDILRQLVRALGGRYVAHYEFSEC
ncbi:MAG: deoxyribose-phosphate aldolase [Phycisphaerae bacterium]|nr:deoxyribose-phosphate aldolase [Phycisphaerae bacterium]